MATLINYPLVLLVVSLAALLLAALFGVVAQKAWSPVKTGEQNEFNIVQSAALTLLGLIVGFSFSMAISRYDQRKNLEEAEANAIGTEYVRVDLLADSVAAEAARGLLKQYLDQRILFYETRDRVKLDAIAGETARVGADLWVGVRTAAATDRTAIGALVASGMNDVLNSADYTEAAWLNRIPVTAWWLMIVIGVACNITLGFGSKRLRSFLLLILPVTVSISLFLIADIDSPRSGLVNVVPHNLDRLAASLNGR